MLRFAGVAVGADFDQSGSVNQQDLTGFGAAFVDGSADADHNGDGVVDSADVTAFLSDFAG